jgi:hypothetical protein
MPDLCDRVAGGMSLSAPGLPWPRLGDDKSSAVEIFALGFCNEKPGGGVFE